MGTQPRSVRIDDADLDLAERIRAARPSYQGEKDIFRAAITRGLRILAAEATQPGVDQYGGIEPQRLASELRQLMLPVLEFLATHHALPVLVQHAGTQSAPAIPPQVAPEAPPSPPPPSPEEIYQRNTNDLRSLMGNLDDDD